MGDILEDSLEYGLWFLLGVGIVVIIFILVRLYSNFFSSVRVASRRFQSQAFYRNHLIVVGLSRIGIKLANEMLDNGRKVVVISEAGNNTQADRIRKKGGIVLNIRGVDETTLYKAGITRASKCLLVSESDELNVALTDFITDIKRRGRKAKHHLSVLVHIQNWKTRNLMVDHIDAINASGNIDIRLFDIDQVAAREIYDTYPPYQFVNDGTKKNTKKVICVVGYNDMARAFILENCILSHFPDSHRLEIYLIAEEARKVAKRLEREFPFLEDFITVSPVELLNTSFSTRHDWDRGFIDDIEKIDIAYFFGDEDAQIISTATHFRQFMYNKTENIRKVPLVLAVPEETRILHMLENADGQGQTGSIVKGFKEDLAMHIVKKYSDICTIGKMVDDQGVEETLSKVINYYYSIKYEFDHLLSGYFKKNNNSDVIRRLEDRLVNFKMKATQPMAQLENMIVAELSGYTKNSAYRVKQFFGIEERWAAVSARNKESNRYLCRHLEAKVKMLEALGIKQITKENLAQSTQVLAEVEHKRWSAAQLVADFTYGPLPKGDPKLKDLLKKRLKIHDQLIPFDELHDSTKDSDQFLLIPLLLKVKQSLGAGKKGDV